MSFSKETKESLCAAGELSPEQKTALIYGMALFSKQFSSSAVSMTTESRPAAMTYSEGLASLTGAIVDLEVSLQGAKGRAVFIIFLFPTNRTAQGYLTFSVMTALSRACA